MKLISMPGLDLVKEFEGLKLQAYQDSNGIWTIGYGHTKSVRPGQLITSDQATRFLMDDLEWAESVVNNSVKVPLTQNQFDALVSFVFNVGAGNFESSTLLKDINQRSFQMAAAQFSRWVYDDNGHILPGLVKRREAEAALFIRK